MDLGGEVKMLWTGESRAEVEKFGSLRLISYRVVIACFEKGIVRV